MVKEYGVSQRGAAESLPSSRSASRQEAQDAPKTRSRNALDKLKRTGLAATPSGGSGRDGEGGTISEWNVPLDTMSPVLLSPVAVMMNS